MEKIIIAAIVAITLFYLIRRAWKTVFRQEESSCGCGCTSCSSEATCDDITKTLSEGNSE